jgi:segregation and condensation protein A
MEALSPSQPPLAGHANSPSTAPARLYGAPLLEIPKDLYIPPDALEVFLEAFEGPLDLLLYLIRKASINILDIPMALLTAQYLEYVDRMSAQHLDLACDYLLMAAVLLEIKSRLLLPRPAPLAEEAPDPRAGLVQRLLEYERIRLAARELDALPRIGRDHDWAAVLWTCERPPLPPVLVWHDLLVAWLDVEKRGRLHAHHRIAREPLSVSDYMARILQRLRAVAPCVLRFEELLEPDEGRAVCVVRFLAVLELTRARRLTLTQEGAFSPLWLALHRENAHV